MNYLSLLDLEKEPFSNSPDPDFFFASDQHMRSLQRLELAIRLRKGLSVALGEVGTGKTTLCRSLIRRLDKDGEQVSVHLFLDPEFASATEFLRAIAGEFGLAEPGDDATEREMKETIKQHLFARGVDEEKITVLILDEGQKLPGFCLEILREFLNFETNRHKLLQIVIFAQLEFRQALKERANFSDRIAELCTLTPLNFTDTRRMILFRLRQAHGRKNAPKLFSFWALLAVYRQTGGYPRKIVQLCSQALLALIIQNKSKVSAGLVRACGGRLASGLSSSPLLRPVLLAILLAVVLVWRWEQSPAAKLQMTQVLATMLSQQQVVAPAGPPVPATFPAAAVLPEDEVWEGGELPVTVAMIDAGPPHSRQSEAIVEKVEIVSESESKPDVPAKAALPGENTAKAFNQEELFRNILADPMLFPDNPLLGELTINSGDFLSRMIKRVYGDFNQELLRMVTAANPQLRDTDLIPVGTVIRFPAASRPYRVSNHPGYRLLLGEKGSLAEADHFLKECLLAKVAARLVPVWKPEQGLLFMVMGETLYDQAEAAASSMAELPADLASNASKVHNWEEAYLHFASRIEFEH